MIANIAPGGLGGTPGAIIRNGTVERNAAACCIGPDDKARYWKIYFFKARKKETVRARITAAATASAMGAARRSPSIPRPVSRCSRTAERVIARGVKHTMSRTREVTTACTGFPMDWKKTVVIFTRQVTVTRDS